MQHHAGQRPGIEFLAFTDLAGLEVLTKDAAEIAPGKEDGARALPATQHILFTEVRKGTGDAGVPTNLADAELVGTPIDALAQARAGAARRSQVIEGLLDLILE